MKSLTFIILGLVHLFSSGVEGIYNSWQCGEMSLELKKDSSFVLTYSHFEWPYKRISSGYYSINLDTLTITETAKRFEKEIILDTLNDTLEIHKLIFIEDNKLKCLSLYCGDVSVRQKYHWAYFEKAVK